MQAAPSTPQELRDRLEAERRGLPFLLYRGPDGVQRIVELGEDAARLPLGRGSDMAIRLDWDPGISRLHAELERIGATWLVVDDGLSSNGSFVNEQRVHGRRRLADGDVLRFGDTRLTFREPRSRSSRTTVITSAIALADEVTDTQRKVLVALARPLKGAGGFATPATNPRIAAELHLSQGAVKGHLRALYTRFGIDDLPQNAKRLRLVELAFQTGLVGDDDL